MAKRRASRATQRAKEHKARLARTRSVLLAAFSGWLADKEAETPDIVADELEILTQLFEAKAELGDDPSALVWSVPDTATALTAIVPPSVSDEDADAIVGWASLALDDFLTFLSDTDRWRGEEAGLTMARAYLSDAYGDEDDDGYVDEEVDDFRGDADLLGAGEDLTLLAVDPDVEAAALAGLALIRMADVVVAWVGEGRELDGFAPGADELRRLSDTLAGRSAVPQTGEDNLWLGNELWLALTRENVLALEPGRVSPGPLLPALRARPGDPDWLGLGRAIISAVISFEIIRALAPWVDLPSERHSAGRAVYWALAMSTQRAVTAADAVAIALPDPEPDGEGALSESVRSEVEALLARLAALGLVREAPTGWVAPPELHAALLPLLAPTAYTVSVEQMG